MKYNKESLQSVYEFSCRLIGKSLREVVNLPVEVTNVKNRGDLGSLVEKYYFEHVPPNTHDPDFAEIGLELKTTGLEKYKKSQKSGMIFRVKERLVLTTINFETIQKESWENSILMKKCQKMLVLFYEYEKSLSVIDRKFVLAPLIIYFPLNLNETELSNLRESSANLVVVPPDDMAQIKRDWETIQEKIASKKAHELSEGDTYYLGACRKGAGGTKEVAKKQSDSEIGAMGRAFALKPSYVKKLIEIKETEESLGVGLALTFEDATLAKFQGYLGCTVDEISEKIGYQSNAKHKKNLYSRRILARSGSDVAELLKAGITMKTFSLTNDGRAREDVSFPAFKFLDVAEQNWEESDFADQIEGKFLFVVFKMDSDGNDRLEKVMYWNMPYEDRLEAQRVWELAKKAIKINARLLPKKSESSVSHVRPHGKNHKDTDLTPQGEYIAKKCFWLNGDYVARFVS